MRLTALCLANFALALGLLAIGLPNGLGAMLRLPANAVAGAVESGGSVDPAAIPPALGALRRAARFSAAAHADIGALLLASSSATDVRARGEEAAQEFRRYLAGVPGDAAGWEWLARAELAAGHPPAARAALDMSLLIGPRELSLALRRCQLAMVLGGPFAGTERPLLEQQFQMAADYDVAALARLVQQQNALLLTRTMLIGAPAAMAKFEAQWARS